MKTKLERKIDYYVSEYAKKHRITKEQALQMETVQNVIQWLKEMEEKKHGRKS